MILFPAFVYECDDLLKDPIHCVCVIRIAVSDAVPQASSTIKAAMPSKSDPQTHNNMAPSLPVADPLTRHVNDAVHGSFHCWATRS